MSGENGYQLLVVEDDQDIRELLEDLLLEEGYTVRSAVNGRDALQFLESTDLTKGPKAIFSDVFMPDIDGIELVKLLSEHQNSQLRTIPVYLMSSATMNLTEMTYTPKKFLRKPLEIPVLLGLAAEAVGPSASRLSR